MLLSICGSCQYIILREAGGEREPYVIMSDIPSSIRVLLIMNIELPKELVLACEVDIVFVVWRPGGDYN